MAFNVLVGFLAVALPGAALFADTLPFKFKGVERFEKGPMVGQRVGLMMA